MKRSCGAVGPDDGKSGGVALAAVGASGGASGCVWSASLETTPQTKRLLGPGRGAADGGGYNTAVGMPMGGRGVHTEPRRGYFPNNGEDAECLATAGGRLRAPLHTLPPLYERADRPPTLLEAASHSDAGRTMRRRRQDVHYRVSAMGGKIMDVLKGITGTVPAQTFSVVLGPSGAGKSSLFDVLLGVAEGVVFRGCAHHPQPTDAPLLAGGLMRSGLRAFCRHRPRSPRGGVVDDERCR